MAKHRAFSDEPGPESPLSRLGAIFSPENPVEDPEALFGRESELREILVELGASSTTVPVIIGPPGIGKSSILAMVRQVLTGFDDVLGQKGLSDCRPKQVNRLVIRSRCSKGLSTGEKLSRSILDMIHSSLGTSTVEKKFQMRGFDLHASVPIASVGASWEAVEHKRRRRATEELVELTRRVASDIDGEVVIMLDECEQLPWLSELLDYTRRFDEVDCRFVLALRDHSSHKLAKGADGDYRWPKAVDVRRLTRPEVEAMFGRATRMLNEVGIAWTLSTEAFNYVNHHSRGEPWYLQMIGWELIFDESKRMESRVGSEGPERVRVGMDDVREAEKRMLNSRLRGLHAEMYQILTKRAPKREELLRAMAIFPETVIPYEYIELIRSRRIPTAFRILSEMIEHEPDPVFINVDGRLNVCEFADHQFRVYCRLAEANNGGADVFAEAHAESWVSGR